MRKFSAAIVHEAYMLSRFLFRGVNYISGCRHRHLTKLKGKYYLRGLHRISRDRHLWTGTHKNRTYFWKLYCNQWPWRYNGTSILRYIDTCAGCYRLCWRRFFTKSVSIETFWCEQQFEFLTQWFIHFTSQPIRSQGVSELFPWTLYYIYSANESNSMCQGSFRGKYQSLISI